MKRKRFFAFLLTFVFAFTMCFADVTSAFAYDETEVAEDMSAVEEESVTAAEDDALSEGESANTDAQELDRNVVLLKVSLDGEVKAELTLADLEGIMEAEGSKTYQYSAFNRYVSYKGSELECVKGPTIEGILNSAGIEVEQLSDTGTITFTGFDEISHTFMIGELFADRYYYPYAGNYAGYKTGDAVMEGTDDGAQEVPAVLSIIEPEDATEGGDSASELTRLVFGQRYPNEQNYTAFTKYMLDINGLMNGNIRGVSEIAIYSADPGSWEPINGLSVGDEATVYPGTEIYIDSPYPSTGFPLVVYTTDSSEPNMGSEKYNYGKDVSQLRPIKIAEQFTEPEEPIVVKVKIVGYGKTDSETKVYRIHCGMPVPEAFTAASYKYDIMRLQWTGNKAVTKYEIYRYNSSKADYDLIGEVEGADGTLSFLDPGRKFNTTYKYKIRAYVQSTDSYSDYTVEASAKTKLTTPTIKSISFKKSGSKRSVILKWGSIKGATGYKVYRSTKSSSGFKLVKTLKGNSKVSFKDTKVKKKKTYYYKVRAYRTVSGKNYYSSYSKVVSQKIKK